MLLAGCGVLVAVAVAVAVLWSGDGVPPRPVPPVPVESAASPQGGDGRSGGPGPSGAADVPVLPASPPVRLRIPSIGVDSSLERLGRDARRVMETPRDPDRAGWYTPGPTPGERGPSVIAGHVTWDGAESVFFELAALRPGARVEVTRRDGTTARFTVDGVERYPKDDFPTTEVYRNLDHAGLRLITCGGDYSEADRRYADNVVVFATLSGGRPARGP